MERCSFFYHALQVNEDVCIGCSHCMKSCPTEAIRIRNGKAKIYENRCVDCGECYKGCPVRAIYVEQDDFEEIFKFKYRVALVPAIFLGQFAEDVKSSQVYSVLKEIGFTHVQEVESANPIYSHAKNNYCRENTDEKPLISTFCPAIVRLIQVKFPSLVDNLIHIKAPVDISSIYIKKKLKDEGAKEDEIGIFYITPCAAKIASVKSPVGEDKSLVNGVINMDSLYNKAYKEIRKNKDTRSVTTTTTQLSSDSILMSLTNGERRMCIEKRSFAIDGVENVMDFLEKLENEEIENIDFLELRACDQSCAGGILTCGNRFVISERVYIRARKTAERERNGIIPKEKEMDAHSEYLMGNISVGKIRPRSMMVLDENISLAIEKMEKIREINNFLPQTDCCVCGAPTCHSLAEDIVMGKAEMTDCVFIQRNMEARDGMSSEESIQHMKKIWGNDKLNQYINKK